MPSMPAEVHDLGVTEMAAGIADGSLSARALVDHHLARIETHDAHLHGFLHVDVAGARAQADRIDRARAAGKPLAPLAGVPIAVKDNMCTRTMPTTCASRMLAGYQPPYDAHVVECLAAAGAVILGKTNLDEFAMGSSTDNSAFGPTHNPWDLTRSPGGSSGGSASSVAARLSAAALGSDTGGSVRQPAAFCGLTAIKPTYGRVSRYGLVAFASSLDQVGPIARSARDAGRVLSAIAGYDRRDATSIDRPGEDFTASCGEAIRGVRVGVLAGAALEQCDPEMQASFKAGVQRLQDLGCQLVDVKLPHMGHGIAVYYLVAPAEASSNLARFDGMRYGMRKPSGDLRQTYAQTRADGFGTEVKRRIMLGTYALSSGYYDAFYLKAQRVRTLIRNDYEAAFAKCDVIASPTTPRPAFEIGAMHDDPLAMYLEDIFVLPPSLAGLPAVATPCGITRSGLPLGMQLTGSALSEAKLVQVADAFERDLAFDSLPPGLGRASEGA
ncbi:MAG: Asp-tRNA(Asn)/Glu-tRNA(Gln) amidotransferase subunit GatA [Myxococcales bacterium]|nr:Asp-tRNA(Asn)/Glu-tRNA(Gln) amidotransferase subunit GatA [Myxococcales bacterium]MDD9969885.1 Asp-tRNA(Asn)/Glu-tRNA(Gln) amidotransferase subunit GatA [Myxococcales bacterium]